MDNRYKGVELSSLVMPPSKKAPQQHKPTLHVVLGSFYGQSNQYVFFLDADLKEPKIQQALKRAQIDPTKMAIDSFTRSYCHIETLRQAHLPVVPHLSEQEAIAAKTAVAQTPAH